MSRFNAKTQKAATPAANTINRAGGKAYTLSPKTELVNLLTSSMMAGKGLESDSEQINRLKGLLDKVDPLFAAKCALYVRKEHGLRSVTHVLAALLSKKCGAATPWAKKFYDKIVYRPDDMSEIAAATWALTDIKVGVMPRPMKLGFAKALERQNEYNLAKYRGGSKEVSLIDLVRLTHSKKTLALEKLVYDKLPPADTWEKALSAAGSDAEAKSSEWKRMLTENKLGIFAALRNINNIVEACGSDKKVMQLLISKITDPEGVQKSLILPFQFAKAIEAVEANGKANSAVLDALRDALDLSLANCPDLVGDTVVVLDVSGSMAGDPIKIGALFSAVLIKALKDRCRFMMFATDAKLVNVSTRPGTWEISQEILKKCGGGGTNFHTIFQTLKQHKISAERVLILSDMMGWMGFETPQSDASSWARSCCKVKPTIYNWNLNAAGSTQLTQSKDLDIVAISGWTDKVFDQITNAEESPDEVLKEIEAVEL